MNNRLSQSFFWKLLERFGVSGIQFVLQLILARLLDPEHYGVLAIMTIFTSLANVFIQSGFNTALIQNKDVEEEDYSSVLWISLVIAAAAYGIIFLSAPAIAVFYSMPGIVAPLRVLALMLFPGALNSIQLAKVSRDMDFRKVFVSSIAGVTFSGALGILVACLGGGLWALVAQNIANVLVTCFVMHFTLQLKLRFFCNFKRIKVLFRFGWKLLLSSLLDTLYNSLNGLVIGRKYSSETLAYYDRGRQFPGFLMDSINGAVQSVMLPAMSAEQSNKAQVKNMMRASLTTSAYIVMPMMAGLAAVATPLITILLTDKWLFCVPYLQVCCCTYAFYPIHSCNLQAVNALGRSDIFLYLELIKKSYGIVALIIAVLCFDSPLAIPASGIITTWISWFVNAHPNKKLLGYSFFEQVKDLAPYMLMSAAMCICVLSVALLKLSPILTILIQVPAGVAVYLLLSWIIKPAPYRMLLDHIKQLR